MRKPFSSVTILKSIWIMLAIAAYYDNEDWLINVNKVFWEVYLQQEICREQLDVFASKPNF